MPPPAISRSRTYFPKIWGNIAPGNRSALCAVLLLSGCAPEPEPDRIREVRAHIPPNCAPAAPALDIQLEALGDFEASTLTSESVDDDDQGVTLAFPAETRAVTAKAGGAGSSWLGVAAADGADHIDLVLWPADQACELLTAGAGDYPPETRGAMIGWSPRHRALLVAGSLVANTDAARAVHVDLADGTAQEIPDGMLPARALGTITELGDDALLVAGGVDPTLSGGDPALSPPVAVAAVYDIVQRRFDRNQPIQLSQPRARHAAVVLGSGETLLVAGSGQNNLPLATLEAISPGDRAARVAGLATLTRQRSAPTALVLDDGRVFVGGGKDAVGAPVQTLEWLSADASQVVLTRDGLVVSAHHAFTAMPEGSVLAIGVCVPSPECQPATVHQSVTWFRADGTADALPALAFDTEAPVLIPASNGAPWLIAGVTGARVWRRFDPWGARFEPPPELPATAPEGDEPRALALDPGLFVWLSRAPTPRLLGFRHDVRGTFARDLAPLLLTDATHVAPSHAPIGAEQTGIELSGQGLTLVGPQARVVVTETRYAALHVELELVSGPPPELLLGDGAIDEVRLGGAACPWPDTPASPGEKLELRRSDASAVLVRGGLERHCSAPPGRVSLGLAGGDAGAPTLFRALSVRRSAK